MQPAADGGLDAGLEAGVGVEFLQHAGDPAAGGVHVYAEPAGDGLVLQAGGEQPEEFPLVRGEGAAGAAERGGARPQGFEQR